MYTNFEFDGRKLSDFGCIVANINSNVGYRENDLGNSISFNMVKNNHSSIHYVTSSQYDNVYSVTLQIIKDIPRNNYNNVYFNQLEVRELLKWLNRRGHFKFKPIYNDVDDCDVHYYGSFNVDELKIDDKTIGLSIVFTSNSPYAYGELIEFTTITSLKDEHIFLYGDSDEFTLIYPKIVIKYLDSSDDGNLTITNTSLYEDNILELTGCKNNEVITIDCENGLIYSDIRTDEEMADCFNYNFISINAMDYFCQNEYIISNPCEITMSYEPIRKVGGY